MIYLQRFMVRARSQKQQPANALFPFVLLAQEKMPQARGTAETGHRLFMVAVMLASKYLNDQSLSNRGWARLSGRFTLDEVNEMEIEFLFSIRFELHVPRSQVDQFVQEHVAPIDRTLAQQMHQIRAWVTVMVDAYD